MKLKLQNKLYSGPGLSTNRQPRHYLDNHGQTPHNKTMPDWYLYMVSCRGGSLYTGITTDVARRLAEHRGSGNAGAKYLRGRQPLTLVLQQKIGSRSLALAVESRVKKLPKARKAALISDATRLDEIIRLVGSPPE